MASYRTFTIQGIQTPLIGAKIDEYLLPGERVVSISPMQLHDITGGNWLVSQHLVLAEKA